MCVFILFSTSVVIAFGTVEVLCSPLFFEIVPLKKKIWLIPSIVFTRVQAAGIPSQQDLGFFDSKKVRVGEAEVPVCLFS